MAMAANTASTIRNELNVALGHKAGIYWDTLSQYLSGHISRVEFDELVRHAIDTPPLVQLHNTFIAAILGSPLHQPPPTPPPDAPGKPKPLRKRKRTLPYQGPHDGVNGDVDAESGTLRSARIKRWTVGMGKKERERVKALQTMAAINGPERPLRLPLDEINSERGLALPRERGTDPGTIPPVNLASVTRASTSQHIAERINLISAQHNLNMPSKACATLMMYACEAKLKQLITQALSLTSSSHAITSIQPTKASHTQSRVLGISAFDTLLTLRPAVLPNQSAAATRLISEGDFRAYFDQEVQFKERHTEDPRWQLFAILAERSTVREALLASATR